MAPEDTETLLSFFKALADGTRLRMVGLLAERERTVDELATLLQLKSPTISHHLSRLAKVGLVAARAEGTTRHYRLVTERLEALSKEVLAPGALTEATRDVVPDAWQRKVLRSFVEEGVLLKIPGTRKKRQVILEWLVQDFEPGRGYDELEVNAVLLARHPDAATLRRELVGCSLMQREAGIYRVV